MNTIFKAIVCDVGGTYFRIAFMDEAGELHQLKKEPMPSHDSGSTVAAVVEHLLARTEDFIQRVQPGLLDPAAPLVCAVPGPVADHRVLLGAPPLFGRTPAGGVPDIQDLLFRRLGRPVLLLNDLSAAAWFLSTVFKNERFIIVTVSTGIGSKIYDSAHPLGVLDDQPFAGEIGHFTVDTSPEAQECDCGGRGHLGAIASGRGFERMARRAALAAPTAFKESACVRKFSASLDVVEDEVRLSLTNEDHLVSALRSGDPWAKSILKHGIHHLAKVLVGVVVATGIKKVFLIGGFAQAIGHLYRDMLTEEVKTIVGGGGFSPDADKLIELRNDEETCLRGAATYAQRWLRERRASDKQALAACRA